VLGARREDRLAQTRALVEAEGRRGLAVRADVTNPEDCTALASAAMGEFGRVDVLVNNAGVGTAVPALKETPEQFRSVVDLNLNASYWMAQACARVMQPGSSIINISSVLALTSMGLPQAAYTASKAAVIGLTRDLAQQWTGRKGIRVNAIAPGHFGSEMSDQFNERTHAAMVARAAVGRLGEPGELNGALIFLASPASSYITGIVLPVDGGTLLT
jgi:NAD(P)-dependent dehydrogenase (short-subunit alcohol dehydrogenase family)